MSLRKILFHFQMNCKKENKYFSNAESETKYICTEKKVDDFINSLSFAVEKTEEKE